MKTSPPAPRAGRSRLVARALIVGAAAAAMLLVPLTALDDQRPSFFGWHMYAANVAAPQVDITLTDGSIVRRHLSSFAAGVRPEIDYAQAAARFLCEREPDVVSVHLSRDSPPLNEEFSCSAF